MLKTTSVNQNLPKPTQNLARVSRVKLKVALKF